MISIKTTLFGTPQQPLCLSHAAPCVGTTEGTLRRWKSGSYPYVLTVFARLCRLRGLTDEQIGQIVRQLA